MYSIWFWNLDTDERIEIKVRTIESAQKVWDDIENSGWHMLSTRP